MYKFIKSEKRIKDNLIKVKYKKKGVYITSFI